MKGPLVVIASAALLSLCLAPAAFAQKPTPATPKAAEPPMPAKWVVPIKGKASVEFIVTQKREAGDLVSTLKVKNTSTGPIALLRIDEYWYNKKRETVSSGTVRDTKPLMPNEIVDLTIRCPDSKDIDTNQLMFSHANGQIEPKPVKKFSEK